MTKPTVYTVTDLDGSNPRQHTLASFLADHEARKIAAMAKFNADCVRGGLRNPFAKVAS